MLQDEVRTDHGLIVEENATEVKRTSPEINLNQPGFEQLPIPKRQKSSLTGRVWSQVMPEEQPQISQSIQRNKKKNRW